MLRPCNSTINACQLALLMPGKRQSIQTTKTTVVQAHLFHKQYFRPFFQACPKIKARAYSSGHQASCFGTAPCAQPAVQETLRVQPRRPCNNKTDTCIYRSVPPREIYTRYILSRSADSNKIYCVPFRRGQNIFAIPPRRGETLFMVPSRRRKIVFSVSSRRGKVVFTVPS